MSEQHEFKVGDKVKQATKGPYGYTRGVDVSSLTGEVVRVDYTDIYPVGVRFPEVDDREATPWPFKHEELALVQPSLYENVAALTPGTIFIVGQGDPWIRTRRGVTHLYSVRDGVAYGNMEIPEGWKTYEVRDITVLYEPFQVTAPTPEKTKVYVVTGVDYDCFEIDEVFATREAAEARVADIRTGKAPGVDWFLTWTVEEKEVQ